MTEAIHYPWYSSKAYKLASTPNHVYGPQQTTQLIVGLPPMILLQRGGLSHAKRLSAGQRTGKFILAPDAMGLPAASYRRGVTVNIAGEPSEVTSNIHS